MSRNPDTVESVAELLEAIIVERQVLRGAGAGALELERNRRRLVEAQAVFSRLLVARHLPAAAAG
jgi:hypothetical protein